ncbi:caprin-1-like isoform X4 [Ischnura elegans]|uniref:caprin-1-like isoform X4 n=1 Tax=Ischnura elegans TaxID=197161 RepID=UPI001ED87D86|nr:caprin-1-like isoform X4 [Ischnura elegans]
MPSASAKLEKQASTEAVDPLRQAITVIEHKIRNLEKRKVKLESYKEEQKNGKDLNSDQYTAVAKYDEVIQTLEFARELNKNFSGIAADAAKALKKQQRKEQLERAQQEINRVKEILVIQEVLLNVGQDSVREDFLAAKNGAAQLTVDEIKYLDDLYLLLSPKHIPEENMPPYQEQLTHAAEHLINLVEGRSKEVVGTTYAGLKELITKIHTCGYFDQNPEEEEEVVAAEEVAEEVTIPQVCEEAPMEGYVDPCGVSQETLKANLVAAIPDVLPPQAAPIAPSSVIPPEASFFTPPVPTSNVVPSNVPSDFPPHPAPSAPPMQQPVQGHALPDTFDSGFDFIQESQLEVDATAPPHVDLAGDPSNEKARFGTTDLSGETTEDADLQTGTSWADTSQEEVFVQQNQSQRGGYGNRGGRGMNRGGRGNSNGYNGRGRGNYSNGRGGYSGYRGNQEGGNQYYQNGYQQRDNYGNNSGGSGGGYGNGGYAKSGPRGGGGGAAGNGGTQRTNRGRGGQGRGANMRGGGRGGSYVRGGGGGGNKQ